MAHKSSEEITAEQIRAARSALGISAQYVAEESGLGLATIKRYEATTGVPKTRKGNLLQLREFYQRHGIEFIGTADDRPGIRIGKPKT